MRESLLPNVWQYLCEVRAELRKTTWPTRAEVMRSTRIVVGMILILGGYLAVVDALLNGITRSLGVLP